MQVKPKPSPLYPLARPTGMGEPKVEGEDFANSWDGTQVAKNAGAEDSGSSPSEPPPAGDDKGFVPEASARELKIIEGAKHFFRGLQAEAESIGASVPELLTQKYGSSPEALKNTKARMLEVIPWQDQHGYLPMLSTPRVPRLTGRVHVAMLSFNPGAYHGNGLYSCDVLDALDIFYQSRGTKCDVIVGKLAQGVLVCPWCFLRL